jgi:FtsH-binding integral membrane protein
VYTMDFDDLEAGRAKQGNKAGRYTPNPTAFIPHNDNIDDQMRSNGVPVELVQSLRNAFIRKVYSILVVELIVTVGICAFCMYYSPVQQFCVDHPQAIIYGSLIPTIIALVALFFYKQHYPCNFVLLSVFILLESWTIGVVCALYKEGGRGQLVLQAFGITLAVFLSLTLYTCQSKRDFSFMGGMLGAGLIGLLIWGFMNIIFGWHVTFLYSLFGALLFCGFIIYDTFMIMKKYSYDDYLIASVDLYLDFLNLFLFILQLLGGNGRQD